MDFCFNTRHLLSKEKQQSSQKGIVLYCLLIFISFIIGKVNQRLVNFSRIWRANIFREEKMHTKKNTKTNTKRDTEKQEKFKMYLLKMPDYFS